MCKRKKLRLLKKEAVSVVLVFCERSEDQGMVILLLKRPL